MTNSEAIKILEEVKTVDDSIYQYNQEYTKALDMAIKTLEQQSCEDCVSREEVINILNSYHGYMGNDIKHEIWNKFKELPSVTPKPKMGQWIRIDKDKLKCSECEVIHYIAQYPQSANINYCPNCGTKMEVEEC